MIECKKMNFVSTFFVFYFVFVFLGNWFLRKRLVLRNIFLLLSSYIFYATWDRRFLIILLVVSFFSYLIGKRKLNPCSASDGLKNRILLVLGLILNLGTLCFFKYYEFFMSSAQTLFHALHINVSVPLLHVMLPIGLSFYIFRIVSYIVDRYRGNISENHSILDFMLYVAYFPQLLSGPIMRFNTFLREVRKELTGERIKPNRAVVLILTGLFKKVVLASHLSTLLVDDVFAVPLNHSAVEALISVYAYTMQIYLDFSGYTDLSNGISLLLGIKPPANFNQPYISVNLSEFWKRWHITLSQWLRDYLYIPLGGNRVSKFRKYLNLMVTMLLGGFWHGAGWQFVVWGGIHGLGLVTTHAFRDLKERLKTTYWRLNSLSQDRNLLPLTCGSGNVYLRINKNLREKGVLNSSNLALRFICWLLTFNFVAFAWIFFRASSLQNALCVVKQLFNLHVIGQKIALFGLVVLSISFVLHFVGRHIKKIFLFFFNKMPLIFKTLIVTFLSIMILELGPEIVPPFIYFNF